MARPTRPRAQWVDDRGTDSTSRDCPLNTTVLSFSRRNFVINAYRSVARRKKYSTRPVVRIPCEHVHYAVSLLHRSPYVFAPPVSPSDNRQTCNTFDARNVARATLDTCDALNIASFRLVYTGKTKDRFLEV
ncbi:hypothetical protein LSAT2_023685 [Lamellibrachia satsuma]|nr:hypothetical protein LSAT2_023685 [Lamellibrachia satsuma]